MFERKNAYQFDDCFGLKSNLPLITQHEADSFGVSQPWPSLRPLPARVGPCNDVRDFNDGRMHETMDSFQSQPWPSCDVKKPASQSCRITDSRLTSSLLTPAPLSQKRPRDKPVRVLDSVSHFPGCSPTYLPIVSPTITPHDSSPFHAPLSSATRGQVSQGDWRQPSKTIVPTNANSNAASRGQGQRQGSNNFQGTPYHNPAKTVSSLKTQLFKQPSKTTVAPGHIICQPVNNGYTGATRDVDALGSGGDVNFSQIQKYVGCNNAATPRMRADCNPYTPALINFEGSCFIIILFCYYTACIYNQEHVHHCILI